MTGRHSLLRPMTMLLDASQGVLEVLAYLAAFQLKGNAVFTSSPCLQCYIGIDIMGIAGSGALFAENRLLAHGSLRRELMIETAGLRTVRII